MIVLSAIFNIAAAPAMFLTPLQVTRNYGAMVSGLLMPAGMLIFGPLGDVAPIELLLIGTGIVIFLSNLPLVFSKVLRDAGKETVLYASAVNYQGGITMPIYPKITGIFRQEVNYYGICGRF